MDGNNTPIIDGASLGEHLHFLWAKTDRSAAEKWHPLVLHLLDVAACADAIMEREPSTTRECLSATLGLDWPAARPWLLTLIACHDLGKACPGFQSKWSYLQSSSGLPYPRSPNQKINHAYVSQIALGELLRDCDWSPDLADLLGDAVGCHHGSRCSPYRLEMLEGDRRALGAVEWRQARQRIFQALRQTFGAQAQPTATNLSGPGFMLISGLTSFADWIGSNDAWFPFGAPEDCTNLQVWFEDRKGRAEQALDALGWSHRTALSTDPTPFAGVFGFPARPLQEAIAQAMEVMVEPGILLVEAPMGEGKTEAAFFAHLELQRRLGHRGLYVALPTKATGNAMFHRTREFLDRQGAGRILDLQLLHGATLLNEEFQALRIRDVHDEADGGAVRASEWFTHKKRALLSEYGVGTVDQALVPILPVRHNFVRLWGLANRVVIFDEIHAYDTYTGTLLLSLVRWLLALRSSVVLLSATLSPSFRCNLAKLIGAELPAEEPSYPRLSRFQSKSVVQTHFSADPKRRRTLLIQGIGTDLNAMYAALQDQLPERGAGMALVNTVKRAQELFTLFPEGEPLVRGDLRVGKRLPDGTEIYLFHARFPANLRQGREDQALATFGPAGNRSCRRILIATQVAEQSLDLDFDLMATDLAPIDLLLQRAGRMWRHERGPRPIPQPNLLIAGLSGNEPPGFADPLWWSAVYREDVLLRTWLLLRDRDQVTLPDEIDLLVQAVYERQVEPPPQVADRLMTAESRADKDSSESMLEALRASIGSPDDASWNDPARFVLYDEDAPGVHRTLMAQTRQGDDSVTAIPIFPADGYRPEALPGITRARQWLQRAIGVSRRSVVEHLRRDGIPTGWERSPLLRNGYPLVLDDRKRWVDDELVCLDDDLGLVYAPKER